MRSFVENSNAKRKKTYRIDPKSLKEHYGIEQNVLAGGYGYRQVMELIQNGADAILEADEHADLTFDGNRIVVLLRGAHLYVANTGAPLSEDGVDALLRSHSSPKRDNQIGRFGLGFKSLLKLGGPIDLFTKAAGAIRFDPGRCRAELMRDFDVTEAPGLRLAWPLEDEARNQDHVLSQLEWAETIVRVQVESPEIIEHLKNEIRSFPGEFLLFFPVQTALGLDDGEGQLRELKIEQDGDEQFLYDGSNLSRWRVARRDVRITDRRAVADATHIHARDSVPLSWAVPLEGRREEAGRFWAFFPTETPTHLSGILNAPWKLNSDRNAIIRGEWNSALMIEAAHLIVETLPSLSTKEDPGRPLDAFPRGMERKDEDAAPVVEEVWSNLQNIAVIPDAAGVLRRARELWRHPLDNAELIKQWQALANSGDLSQFTHPSCLERQRAGRLNDLAERLKTQDASTRSDPSLSRRETPTWFSVVASADIQKAIQVLRLAETYMSECTDPDWRSVRPLLRIIPSHIGSLMTAKELVIAPAGVDVPDRAIVASALCDDADAKRMLTDVMKIRELDDSVWKSILSESLDNCRKSDAESDAVWPAFWANLRLAPKTVRDQFVGANRDRIRVRRRDGSWTSVEESLLPGVLVGPEDTVENQKVLIDPAMHGVDGAAIETLGVFSCPEGRTGLHDYWELVGDNKSLDGWLGSWRDEYKRRLQNRADRSYLVPAPFEMPKGWALLPQLTGTPNAELTKRFISSISKGEFRETVQFGHSTRWSLYERLEVPHPLFWLVAKHGTVQVAEETPRLAAVIARRHEPILVRVPGWEDLQTALGILECIAIPPSNTEIEEMWRALIKLLTAQSAPEDESWKALWSGAARDNVVPETLLGKSGEIPISQVFVSSSADHVRRARSTERIVILLDKEAIARWVSKGARDLSELVKPAYAEIESPVILLTDVFPELRDVLKDAVRESASCRLVSELRLMIDLTSELVPCLMRDGTLFLDGDQLRELSRTERLNRILKEIAEEGWLSCEPDDALQQLGDAHVEKLRDEVARGSTTTERLLRAVGNRREPLLEALGGLKDKEFIQSCTPLQLADLVLARLGPATLSTLKHAIKSEGLKPPEHHWNTPEARAFVASIGFPLEFAASPEVRREAEELISGPIELPRLHDFQNEVLQNIEDLLASGTPRRRAVVSLPTGGGKTRVTVEAAVRLVAAPEGNQRSIIWVAQTDELCEQAVQAFRQVWINHGAQDTDLRIVRLWGGNPDPAIQETNKPVVVIASIQTLRSRMGTDDLAWLQNPGLVVVDECHHAITPSYSKLLRWLDAEAPRPGSPEKDEPPVLGLSATPFRTDDGESHRLARRFDNRWFPQDQEGLHRRLCSQGVLAIPDYECLESGAGLLDEEIERLAKLPEPWEGLDFENAIEAINQRLAGDTKRNQCLVERIRRGAEHAILFFSNSVEHAEVIAAQLHLAGIPAAAISGDTPRVARRHFLERFQRGDIRVLCNHTVLSTGFDAPKTDMVIIARQVFSPVRYMQMVGRGLRGEANGGTSRCKIVTVMDNLGRFQDRHAYHFCQRYFADRSERYLSGR